MNKVHSLIVLLLRAVDFCSYDACSKRRGRFALSRDRLFIPNLCPFRARSASPRGYANLGGEGLQAKLTKPLAPFTGTTSHVGRKAGKCAFWASS
jgi:hypothetical protein